MNVIGVLVNTTPAAEAEVAAHLAAMPGVEVHVTSGDGRLVVTATDVGPLFASDSLMAMNHVPHVVGTSLVYHQFEPEIDETGAGVRAA